MKTRIQPALAVAAAVALACAPSLRAQSTSGPDQSQNSRADNPAADQGATSSQSQPGTLDKNNSKNGTTETRDANPGTTDTDSASQTPTKTPNTVDTTGPDANSGSTMANGETHHRHTGKLTDHEFMVQAAQGGMTEVELGKVASEKGGTDQVKQFGAQMVTDHTKANDELKGLAEKKGVTLSGSLDAHHQAMVDRMSKMSGPDFDKAYVGGMVRDHERTVELFQQEAQSGQDPEVKDFASKTLPTLQGHLNEIKGLQQGGVK
ncbi:MAG: DUF4142 domain-containing protein [Verrucomicrobiota bacterium]